MHTERLEKMVELLNRIDHTIKAGYLDHSAFNLSTWKDPNRKGCGTASCAVGFACADEWFNREGLFLNPCLVPEYEGTAGWRAVNRFFNISEEDAYYLFSSASYDEGAMTLPLTVADRITRFMTYHD